MGFFTLPLRQREWEGLTNPLLYTVFVQRQYTESWIVVLQYKAISQPHIFTISFKFMIGLPTTWSTGNVMRAISICENFIGELGRENIHAPLLFFCSLQVSTSVQLYSIFLVPLPWTCGVSRKRCKKLTHFEIFSGVNQILGVITNYITVMSQWFFNPNIF